MAQYKIKIKTKNIGWTVESLSPGGSHTDPWAWRKSLQTSSDAKWWRSFDFLKQKHQAVMLDAYLIIIDKKHTSSVFPPPL